MKELKPYIKANTTFYIMKNGTYCKLVDESAIDFCMNIEGEEDYYLYEAEIRNNERVMRLIRKL